MPVVYQHNINEHTRLAVWHITEDENYFLSKVNVQREITHPHKRLQHLAGRFILRYLFPDFPHHLIEIADTRKPFLPGDPFHFSISHCGDYAAAIVSIDQRVGIDVELLSERIFRVKNKFLHPDEISFLKHEVQSLILAWSAKEALFKWYGEGGVDFSENLKLFPFDILQEGTIEALIDINVSIALTIKYLIDKNFVLAYTVL